MKDHWALALVKGMREPHEVKKKYYFGLGGNRTHNLWIRSTVTLPTELQYIHSYQEMAYCSESNSTSQVQTKAFCSFCAEGIVPRIGENGFQIVVKVSACQISGTRGKGLGKLHINVLLTQGYPGEKMPFSMLGFSVNCYVLCISGPVDENLMNTIRMIRC